jgi:hypothetical protein
MTELWRLAKENVIDSRDLVARLDELIDELDDLTEEMEASADGAAEAAEWREERDAIEQIVETIDGYSGDDAKNGVSLIRDDYFESYARELAEEIGRIDQNVEWPYTHIDWAGAANDLQTDYTAVDINGVDYWFR